MKKIVIGLMLAALCTSVFALKLPTGDNVRASDTLMDGDKILEVRIGGDKPANITTPIGVLPALHNQIVTFYPSGALKSLYVDWRKDKQTISTPIGDLTVAGELFFYESGSPAKISTTYQSEKGLSKLKIGNIEYTVYNDYEQEIYFYDSGNKDVWQPQRVPYKKGDYSFSFEYTNKSGKFDLRPEKGNDSVYEFYPDGSLKGGKLKTSPDFPVMVNGTEVYIKKDSVIEFFSDGSISHFVPDELIQVEQGGLKFTIAAGNDVWLHKDGKIRVADNVKNISSDSVAVGKQAYNSNNISVLMFDEKGNLSGFGVTINKLFDAFYTDGKIKRAVDWTYSALYNLWKTNLPNGEFEAIRTGDAYVKGFSNPKEEDVELHDTYVSIYDKASYSNKKFNLESGDFGAYIANVYFADNGTPTSYTTFKHDLFGNYILDEYGRPIEDTTKKKFTK